MKDYHADYFKNIEQKERKKSRLPQFKPTKWGSTLLIVCTLTCTAFLLINIPRLIYAPPEVVYAEGNTIISKGDLLSQLAITADQAWSDLDPYSLSLRLNQHPWVKKSIIRRVIPWGIEVQITERKPVAYLRADDRLLLIDGEGWVLKKPKVTTTWNLPVITLGNAQNLKAGQQIRSIVLKNILKLVTILEKSVVLPLNTISEIDGRNPLNVTLTTIPYGTKIKLGYTKFRLALQKLKLALPVISERVKAEEIKYIDLRQLNGVAFKKVSF